VETFDHSLVVSAEIVRHPFRGVDLCQKGVDFMKCV